MPYVPRKHTHMARRPGRPEAGRRAGRVLWSTAALGAVLAAALLHAAVTGDFTPADASPVAVRPVAHGLLAGPVRAPTVAVPRATGAAGDRPMGDMPMGDVPGDPHAGTETYGDDGAPVPVANFGVLDQVSDGRTMQVGDAEVNGSPAWVVVQRDSGGRPGAVVGLTRRLDGEHGGAAVVTFNEPVATGRFWVSLHRDLGVPDSYEFPGPDIAVTAAGSDLTRQITLTVR